MLVFRHWHRQAGAMFAPLWFKVLLVVESIPTHAWSVKTVEAIIGSSCLVFELAPASLA
jgi:hypothetical protein